MEPENVVRPRKSIMGNGENLNQKFLDWLRKQDETAPPTEIIEMYPMVSPGVRDNKTDLFVPSPDVAEKPSGWENPSIWDKSIFANPRIREGTLLSVQGNKILNLEGVDWSGYKGFVVVLAGGDEVSMPNDTSGLLDKIIYPYQDYDGFHDTIEGSLLVTMYWLKRRGIQVTEIRIT